jgi:hypothetical protein
MLAPRLCGEEPLAVSAGNLVIAKINAGPEKLNNSLLQCLAIDVTTDAQVVPPSLRLAQLVAMHGEKSHQSRQLHAVDSTPIARAVVHRLPAFEFHENTVAVDQC